MPNLNTKIIWTLIFQQYVSTCRSKNWHQKEICLEDVRLRAQNMSNCSRFDSQHNWGELYDHSMSARIFTLIKNKIFI